MIKQALDSGETDIVAAGGDGTVNRMLNTILMHATSHQVKNIRLGAIGLGSSNDFHKPFVPEQMFENVSCKVDFANARLRDVGTVSYVQEGNIQTRYFLVNASVGITADANRFFNTRSGVLRFLKQWHTPLAILYTALRITFSHKNIPATIRFAGEEDLVVSLTNVGVLKNRHFSGNLFYDTETAYDDGNISVHVCHDMSRLALVRLLQAFSSGTFSKLQNTLSRQASEVSIAGNRPFAVEFDGEVIETSFVKFGILPRYLQVCP